MLDLLGLELLVVVSYYLGAGDQTRVKTLNHHPRPHKYFNIWKLNGSVLGLVFKTSELLCLGLNNSICGHKISNFII